MKYWKVFFLAAVASLILYGSLSTAACAGDERLERYFVNCFLSEEDLGKLMVLYHDERIQSASQRSNFGGPGNLYSGYRAWNEGGHRFFTHFQENRKLFKSKKAAENYYWGLIGNNSMTKKPDRVIRGEFGDVCHVWIYPVGELNNPDEYATKYYIIEKNLITLIRASQKPLPKGKVVYDGLLERISPYIRLALIKSSLLHKYYDTGLKGNRRSSVGGRGPNVRKYIKTQ